MSKVSLAEQIGTIDEIGRQQAAIANRGGKEGYEATMRIANLAATRETLVFLMNNRDDFVAYMEGKKE